MKTKKAQCQNPLPNFFTGEKTLLIDVTFRATPSVFQGGQLLNISAECKNFIFPFLHILMS